MIDLYKYMGEKSMELNKFTCEIPYNETVDALTAYRKTALQ